MRGLRVLFPTPPEAAVSMRTLFGDFVCVNTSGGQSLIRWREWYCEGENRCCVLGAWKKGEPTFANVIAQGWVQEWQGLPRMEVQPTEEAAYYRGHETEMCR